MADASIVRNRAKIDATIGNARGWLALAEAYGSADAYLAAMVPPPPRLPPAVVAGGIPATTAGIGRALGGPAGARLQVRRLDDRLRVHAERRAGRRPRRGLLPVPRRRLTDGDSCGGARS